MFKENTIVVGDCLDIMADMPDNSVDLVLTDPPWGKQISRWKNFGATSANRKSRVVQYKTSDWDDAPLTLQQFQEIQRVSKNQIIFGFNYLSNILPPTPCVIVWDKKCKNGWDCNFSDCEIAWTSFGPPTRCFRHLWMGACRASETGKGQGKAHPTQKPVALMEWIIKKYSQQEDVIFDPFIGSGTTAVAAKMLGRRYYGCDISETYVELARKRLENTPTPLFTM